MSEIERRARFVMWAAHALMSKKPEGRFRKYSKDPYWVHPVEVAEFVRLAGGDEFQIAAALLHDVKEDTWMPDSMILWVDPSGQVLEGVNWLSDKSKPEDGNRKARKEIDRLHSAAAPPRWKSVKLADLASNGWDIRVNDPNFAKVFIREKRLLLEVLADADLPSLFEKASRIAE